MESWHRAQRKNIRRMTDETLEKELSFATGFDGQTTLEQTWLNELQAERERREEAAAMLEP